MDSFELTYRVAFWALPAMLLIVLGVMAVTKIIDAFTPIETKWKRALICPVSRDKAGVELMRSKRPCFPARIKVLRCTEVGSGSVLCDQDCLRLEENQPLEKPGEVETGSKT